MQGEGAVVGFEAERGLGEVTTADGASYPFHCIDIADGTRDIAVGADVAFRIVPKLGRYEATAVRIRRRRV